MIVYHLIIICIFFWFHPFQRARAEIEKYFRSIIGSNENFKICFRDYLTFRSSKGHLFSKHPRVNQNYFHNRLGSIKIVRYQINVLVISNWALPSASGGSKWVWSVQHFKKLKLTFTRFGQMKVVLIKVGDSPTLVLIFKKKSTRVFDYHFTQNIKKVPYLLLLGALSWLP